MGVRALAVYGMPLGLMVSGVLIEGVGYPLTISAYAAVGLLFTVLIAIRWRASIWHSRSATVFKASRGFAGDRRASGDLGASSGPPD